jgi:hypothetical protein
MGTEGARYPMFEQSPGWWAAREPVFYVWGPNASGCKPASGGSCARAHGVFTWLRREV